jgi:hypothetical protein
MLESLYHISVPLLVITAEDSAMTSEGFVYALLAFESAEGIAVRGRQLSAYLYRWHSSNEQ